MVTETLSVKAGPHYRCDLCPNERGLPTYVVCKRSDCPETRHLCKACLEEAHLWYVARDLEFEAGGLQSELVPVEKIDADEGPEEAMEKTKRGLEELRSRGVRFSPPWPPRPPKDI